jgi:hypothetical protein
VENICDSRTTKFIDGRGLHPPKSSHILLPSHAESASYGNTLDHKRVASVVQPYWLFRPESL